MSLPFKSKLFYIEFGNKNGQPIIFLNGWGTNYLGLKKYCLKYYEQEYRCIFIDALGCGQSESYTKSKSSPIFICEQNAEELTLLIKNLNLKNVVLFGNCLGGWIATLTTLMVQNEISALIFIDGYLFMEKEYLPFIIPYIRVPFYKLFFQTKAGLNLANFFVKFGKKITPEQLIEQKNIKYKVALDYIKDLYDMEKFGYRTKIQNLNVKSLFITGEFTMPVIKLSQSYWQDNVVGSKIECVHQSAHLTVSENPDELNIKILDFLPKSNTINNKA